MKDTQFNLTNRDLFSVLLDRHKTLNIGDPNPGLIPNIVRIALKVVSKLKSVLQARDVPGD
jgi:hypothetical protein